MQQFRAWRQVSKLDNGSDIRQSETTMQQFGDRQKDNTYTLRQQYC